MNSDFLRLSRRVKELEKGTSEETGNFLRNDSRYLSSTCEIEPGSNVAHSLRGGSNTTNSSGFPSTYGQYWHFSGSSRPRDLTLWTKNGGENLYFQTYDYPEGNPQGWNEIWHSGNDGAESGLDADKLEGYHGSAYAEPYTYALRESHGYLYATIFNTTEVWDVGNVQPYYLYCTNSSSADRYHRRIKFTTLADRINSYGSAKNSHTHNSLHAGSWNYSYTSYGYIQFGPANTGHAHIYTDRPSFYFNKEIIINGIYVSKSNHGHSVLSNNTFTMVCPIKNYDVIVGAAPDSYSEVSIFPSSDGKGNCGTTQRTWSQCVRRSASTGSNRKFKELIRVYDSESAYETVKDIQIYSFRFKTDTMSQDEIEDAEAKGSVLTEEEMNPKPINWYNLGVMADQALLEILNTYTADDTHINVDNAIFLTMAALKEAVRKIEMLQLEVEVLKSGVT